MTSSNIIDILKPLDYDKNPGRYRSVSIVIVSDTHKMHGIMDVPDGDIFLHCGDFTKKGDWRNLTSDDQIPPSIIDFNEWLGKLPHKHKIVICGNHELGFKTFSKEEIQSKLLTNCTYLHDELIEVEGLSIYGSSWQFDKTSEPNWSSIPAKIDILMTHIPPQFILDLAFQPREVPLSTPCSKCKNTIHDSYEHWGSESLIEQIRQRIQPRIHCFGHVHDDYGYLYDAKENSTLFINAAALFSRQSVKFNFYLDLHKQ